MWSPCSRDALPSGDRQDTARSSVAVLIIEVAHLMRLRAARLFAPSGYPATVRAPLFHLLDAPSGLTQAELANRLGFSQAQVSRRISTLERQGFVRREFLVGDKRAKLIRLEPAGLAALSQSDDAATIERDALFAGVSVDDLQATLRVLRHLADHQQLRRQANTRKYVNKNP